jgi:competence protein ComEC
VTGSVRGVTGAAGRALEELRARPWHVAVGVVVVALIAGPRAPVAVLVAAFLVSVLGSRATVRLALVAALLAAALVGQSRLHAIDATRLGPRIGHAVSSRVTLLETPRRRAFGARVATARLDGERVLMRARRGVRWPTERIGSVLAVRGGLEALPDHERSLRSRGVHAQLRADQLVDTGLVRGGVAGIVDGLRARAQAALDEGVPSQQAALLRGMALGDDAGLPDGVRDEFRASGLSHLVAASGQNVMLLAALVLALCAVAGLGLHARLALVLAMIAIYVPLAGAGPSIQRAGVMGAAAVVAVLASRPAARWHALLLAAAVTLTLNPRAIEDVGWQLSFAAVVAILLMATRLRDGLANRGLPSGLAEATALTGAATLGTAPLIAAHFGQASLVSLPANVAAAPAVAPTMWLGMAAAAIAIAAVVPRSQAGATTTPAGLRITFLDVGQGDATLIQRREAAILFDTGPPDGPILARLRRAGVRRLDLLAVTHAQDDHDGGAAAVLRSMPVGIVLDGRDGVRDGAGARMAAEARRRRIRLVVPRAGQTLQVGGVTIRVLWPEAAPALREPGADPNQRAIVAEAAADSVRVLLTADAESDVLGHLDLEPVDLLKVSHHGSADPGLPAVLARLRPRLAAIEVGRNNRYGHPAASTVRALASAGAALVRTDRDGSIRVEPAGGELRIHTHA